MSKARTILVTGSAGLIGSETVRRFAGDGCAVVGIDNDMRKRFFGEEASTRKTRDELLANVPAYQHHEIDIRDAGGGERDFQAARDSAWLRSSTPRRSLRTIGRRAIRRWISRSTPTARSTCSKPRGTFARKRRFVFTSTNKVYGDTPNRLPLRELPLRWEIEPGHEYEPGISESMSIDQTKHSLFGASKVAADVLVQEYGRYFGMPTACFRGGCLTGPAHAGTELHGFLSYLMKCTVSGRPYRVFGYKGKQVRDNIHSFDLVEAFAAFVRAPRVGGGLQHRRQPPLQLLDARSDRALRGNQRPETCRGNTSRTTASATTSGGSATCGNSASIIRNGISATGCARSWKRSTLRRALSCTCEAGVSCAIKTASASQVETDGHGRLYISTARLRLLGRSRRDRESPRRGP